MFYVEYAIKNNAAEYLADYRILTDIDREYLLLVRDQLNIWSANVASFPLLAKNIKTELLK